MKKINSFQELEFLKNESQKSKIVEKQISSEKEWLFKENYFNEVTLEDYVSGFKSVFTDEQVIKIIYKISNRNIRKLVWEFERIRFTDSDRCLHLKFILHTICLKLLQKYGAKMLSFIIDLKVIDRPDEVSEIHSDIYRLNLENEAKKIQFDSIELRKDWRKFYIGFEIAEFNNKPYMIICNSQGYLLGRINELGYIEDEFINRIRFNIFEFIDDAEISYLGAVLNCRCSICNKELTVPESIYYGKGPICRGDYYR